MKATTGRGPIVKVTGVTHSQKRALIELVDVEWLEENNVVEVTQTTVTFFGTPESVSIWLGKVIDGFRAHGAGGRGYPCQPLRSVQRGVVSAIQPIAEDDPRLKELQRPVYVVKDVHGCVAIEPEHRGLVLVVWSQNSSEAKTFNTREEAQAHIAQLKQLGFKNVASVSPV